MVRKKNKMFVDSADRTPHYSLRKLSVGVASVLLSTTLWMGANGSVAHADTINNATVEKQNGEAQAAVADANQAENKQVQKGDSANVEAQPTTANDAQADVAKQEPAAPSQQAASQAKVSAPASAEEQASTAEQAAAVATEGQTNGSANADTDATTKAKKDLANPEAKSSDAATENAKNESNTLDVSQAFKTSTAAKVTKKMVMSSLASAAKLADQYDAKGATKTVIYGQTIDPNSLIANFSSLPTGTKASASNLDSIKTKQGRNVVPVTVTYSDGSSDAANAIVWVTPDGTTALAKSVSLQSNAATDKPEVTVGAQETVPLEFWFSGSAVLDGSTVKKGTRIYLGQVDEKYNEILGNVGNGNHKSYTVTDKDGDKFGNLVADSSVLNRRGQISFFLDVTSEKKYQNDVAVKFDIPRDQNIYNTDQKWVKYRDVYLTYTDDPYDYKGTIVQKRYLHAVGQDDKEWTINRTIPEIKTQESWNPRSYATRIDPENKAIRFDGFLIGYAGASFNPNVVNQDTVNVADKVAKEIWASKGKTIPSDMPAKQNLHEVWQYTTPSGTYSKATFQALLWGYKQLLTADGQPSNQGSRLQFDNSKYQLLYTAPDNTSAQTLYDSTPSGKIGFSRQGDDSYLICFNLTADDLQPTAKSIVELVNTNPAMALSKDYEKIKQANVDFYANNAVPSFAAWYDTSVLLYLEGRNDDKKAGNYYLRDVTPGHAVFVTKASLNTGTASAGGESRLTNTAYFVDDSQNQAIVGGQHQISGKKGDTVPLNLTVPSGYILASGQSLPTSYTFTGNDSDIVIHLVPIYKSAGQTSDVHRTIDYKTTDGSPAPETKNDDLKFYGTTITGDLSNLTKRAEQDGLIVTKGDAKTYATKQEALADLDGQASDIQGKVTKYESEKTAYDAAKPVYDKDQAKWDAAQKSSDPHMVKDISQALSFANEHDALLDVTSESNKPVNFIKSSAWLGSDGMGVYTDGLYTGGNISKSFSNSDISYSQAEGTGKDIKDWGNTYTGVQLKVGESAVARYTGLKNSVYIDKENVAHKLSKVQVKYELNSTTASDGTANIFLSNNPNIALWYGVAGNRNGSVDLTVDLTFYDENGNPITMGKGSNAWLDMSSLNNGSTKVEYFAPNGNKTMPITDSTISEHNDGWYANDNNE